MYLVSYLGKLMTGLTLVTLVWAGIFSLPRIYKDNQANANAQGGSSELSAPAEGVVSH